MQGRRQGRWLAVALAVVLATACSDGVSASASGSEADAGSEAGASSDPIGERIDRIFPDDPDFGAIDRELVRRMMEVPRAQDGAFFMVNLIKHREHAAYADDRETDLTGAQADALYGERVLPILTDIGARPVFVANVEMTLMSDDGVQYDQIGVVLYPSRDAFFEMLERDDFRQAAEHKQAGVETTLVMPAQPTGDELPSREVDLDAVPFPATTDDQALAIVHLYDYRDLALYADGRETQLTGEEAVDIYSVNRFEQGVLELGVRPGLWLYIEGSLIGDDRQFDEFRTNLFPSHATFWDVAASAGEAGIEHRTAGLEHHYTLMTAPIINEYGYE